MPFSVHLRHISSWSFHEGKQAQGHLGQPAFEPRLISCATVLLEQRVQKYYFNRQSLQDTVCFFPAVSELGSTVSTKQTGTQKRAGLGRRASRDSNQEIACGHKEDG